MNIKPFNLKEYLANPLRKVVTKAQVQALPGPLNINK